jgi:hypothetical protein
MTKLAVITDDLMWGSSALGIASAAEMSASMIPPGAPIPADTTVIAIDLASTGFDGLSVAADLSSDPAVAGKPKIGVYSHVDIETKRRADEIGFDLVLPRSRFAREGGKLIKSLLGSNNA